MPLEADKFLYEKINKEAVDEQKANAEKLKRKIQNIYSEKEGIEPIKEMNIKDYNLFLKRANEFSKTLIELTQERGEGDADISSLVRDWNDIIFSLSRLKYKKLIETDKRKVKERMNEIKPSLQLSKNLFDNLAGQDPIYNIFVDIISKMIRQIDEDLFDQISIPVKDILANRNQPQRQRRQRLQRNVDDDEEFFDAVGPEEEEPEEEEEDDGIDYRIIF